MWANMASKAAQAGKAAWGSKGKIAGWGGAALGGAANLYFLKDLFGNGSRDDRRADAFEFESGLMAEDAMRSTGALMDEQALAGLLRGIDSPEYGDLGEMGDAANMARLESAVQTQRGLLGKIAVSTQPNALEQALDRIGV